MGRSRKKFTRERLQESLRRLSLIYVAIGGGLLVIGIGIAYFSLGRATSVSSRTAPEEWAYFYPRWRSESFFDHLSRTRDEVDERLSQTFTDMHQIIHDPENRVDDRFSVPPYLVSRVLFWLDVYSRYDSRILIVHDRNDIGIVYGYIDFRPLYRSYRSRPMLAHMKARRIEKKIVQQIQHLLRSAGDEASQSPYLPDESAALRSYLKSLGLFSQISALVETVRTQTGQKDKFQIGVMRSRQLMPHIESVFKDFRLPLPLARIPFVESSFNPKAYSRLGAQGLWQIMPATARQLISRDRGKWRDPIAQTRAAAKLLRQYRRILPDWGTTVTAYNSGVGNLQRLLKEYRANNYESLFLAMKDKGLGFAGRNFYSELLAATLVEAYKEKIFKLVPADEVAQVYKSLAPFDDELCQVR